MALDENWLVPTLSLISSNWFPPKLSPCVLKRRGLKRRLDGTQIHAERRGTFPCSFRGRKSGRAFQHDRAPRGTYPRSDNEIAKSNELAAAGRRPNTLRLSTCLWKFNVALCRHVTFVIHRVATCYRQLRRTRCLMERIDIDCKIDDPRGGDPDPNSYRTLNMNHYVRGCSVQNYHCCLLYV